MISKRTVTWDEIAIIRKAKDRNKGPPVSLYELHQTKALSNISEPPILANLMISKPPIAISKPPIVISNPPIVISNPPIVISNPPIAISNPPIVIANPSNVISKPPIGY